MVVIDSDTPFLSSVTGRQMPVRLPGLAAVANGLGAAAVILSVIPPSTLDLSGAHWLDDPSDLS
jgi:hypothetical protein